MRAARGDLNPGSFESEWRRRFERFAESYRQDHCVSGWSEQGLADRLDAFMGFYPRAMPSMSVRVLDVGCGPGTYGRWLADRGNQVVGLDYSWPSLKRAQLHDQSEPRAAVYTQGEVYHLPFGAGVFDAVLCAGVLQTLSDERCAVSEMTRVLKPQGLLIIDALNALGLSAVLQLVRRFTPHRGNRVRRYSPLYLRRCLRALGYVDLQLFPVVMLPQQLQRLSGPFRHAGVFSLPVAHSFFLLARKRGDPQPTKEAGTGSSVALEGNGKPRREGLRTVAPA